MAFHLGLHCFPVSRMKMAEKPSFSLPYFPRKLKKKIAVCKRTCNGLAVFWPTMDLAEIQIYGGLIFALSHEHVFDLTTAYAVT